MASDYETLRQYFALEHKTSDQKLAAAAAFMSGYADLTAEDYPHIREVERARKKLARGQSPTMPSLAGVELVPAGSPSSSPPQEVAN